MSKPGLEPKTLISQANVFPTNSLRSVFTRLHIPYSSINDLPLNCIIIPRIFVLSVTKRDEGQETNKKY